MEHPLVVHYRCAGPHSELAQGQHATCTSAFGQSLFRKDRHDLPKGISVSEWPTITDNPVGFLLGEYGKITMEQRAPPPPPDNTSFMRLATCSMFWTSISENILYSTKSRYGEVADAWSTTL